MENYFSFYNLPFSLHVNQAELRKKFYDYSRKFHPDFHTQSSSEIQEEILHKSTLNNKAFETLSDRDRRIKYILEYKEQLEEGQNPIPQEFLMEMMEFNEALMELEMDFTQDAKLALHHKISSVSTELSQSISELDQADSILDNEAIDKLKSFYLKNQYLKNLFRKLDEMSK